MKASAFSLLALLGLSHGAPAASSANCSLATISSSEQLTWCPCEDGFFCSRLDVPLDYQNPELGRASVPLIKYPAAANPKRGPYQGMVLINPGGPGASGIDEARAYGRILFQEIMGDNWDIIGFDPRGMHQSEPLANCSAATTAQYMNLKSRSVPRMPDDFYDGFIQFGMNIGSQCAAEAGGQLDAGPHMSTATTARDMLSIVDAFAATEDGRRASKPSHLLNYYGLSYGTFLGQTFASMFPERVGSVVLDGVVDPQAYLTNLTTNNVNHLDGAIAGFFIYCHERGPSECRYDTGSSAKDIYKRFTRSYAQLDAKKARDENWSNATDIESALLNLKVGILAAVYAPIGEYDLLADSLLYLENAIQGQKLSKWIEWMVGVYGDPSPAGFTDAQFALGVLCSDQDNIWYNKTLEDFRPLVAELEEQSIVADVWIKTQLGCSGWSIKAAERFTGPFIGDTATPILFVGNTYDPVTPVDNALSSAQKYKGAQALVVDGIGHGIINTGNLCGFNKIVKYFNDGEMPGNDSFCAFQGDGLGISLNGTLEENILQTGLANLLSLFDGGYQRAMTVARLVRVGHHL